MVVLSGLAGIISLMRFGVRTFWAGGNVSPPRLQLSEAATVSLLLLVCVLLTVQAGPAIDYLNRSAAALHQPEAYVERVLSEPAVTQAAEVERP